MDHVSRDSSVAVATDYGLDDRMIRVWFPAGAGNFSLFNRVHIGSGAQPASYPMGTGGSFPVKRPGREADRLPPRMRGAIPPLPITYSPLAWCLVKHRDNLIMERVSCL
jgi:hypothetical protein